MQRSVRQKIFTVNCGGSVVSQAPARKGDQRGCLLQPPSCSGHDQCASVAAAKLHTKSVIRAHYFGLHIDFLFTKLPRTAEAGRKIALLALVWLLRNVDPPPSPRGHKTASNIKTLGLWYVPFVVALLLSLFCDCGNFAFLLLVFLFRQAHQAEGTSKQNI